MEELKKSEGMVGFGALDIARIKSWAQEIEGSWNGKDDRFIYDGDILGEDAASCAHDIVEKCTELEELLDEMAEHI